MALSQTNRGTANNVVSGTSFTCSPATNCTAGAVVLLAVTYQNSEASGADPFSSITDSAGNTWTTRQSATNTAGSTNDGVSVRLFETSQTGGTVTTSVTVTINFSVSVVPKTATFTELTGSVGTPTYSTGSTTTGTGTGPTITTSSITSGDYVFGVTGWGKKQSGIIGTITADSDATSGPWSTQQTTTVSSGTDKCGIGTQGKVTTGTGTQTYNTTINSWPYVVIWAQYTEVIPYGIPSKGALSIPPSIVCM